MVSCRVSLCCARATCHRAKRSLPLLQEASTFFKKRAVLEEELGRGMQKLARNTADLYAMNDGKAGCVCPVPSRPISTLSRPNSLIALSTALSSTHGRQL